MEIRAIDDMMQYFNWVFIAYVVLLVIVCINFIKSFLIKNSETISDSKINSIQIFDLLIDLLCGVAMFYGLMFHGVLADNNAPDWDIWINRLLIISVVSLIVFIANIVVIFIRKNNQTY